MSLWPLVAAPPNWLGVSCFADGALFLAMAAIESWIGDIPRFVEMEGLLKAGKGDYPCILTIFANEFQLIFWNRDYKPDVAW